MTFQDLILRLERDINEFLEDRTPFLIAAFFLLYMSDTISKIKDTIRALGSYRFGLLTVTLPIYKRFEPCRCIN
jgi:hypothetical protein